MATPEFRLFGAMQLRVDGEPAGLPGAGERALLALLLLSPGRPVATSSLIDRLWSEAALPVDPLNALQLRVSKLRRALTAYDLDLLVREATGYRADVDPDRVDVHCFVRQVNAARAESRSGRGRSSALQLYDEALELWRGDPFAEFSDQRWASVEVARLHQLRLAAVTERAETALAVGRHVEVAADLEPLVADDPKQEALAGLLMTALSRSGRQAEALEVFTRTRRSLDDELGLQPSAALRALHQRVLRQDPDLAAVPSAAAPSGVGDPARPHPPPVAATTPGREARRSGASPQDAPAPQPPFPVSVTRLIGRAADLVSIRSLLARERLVSLVGPGGAGKTSLALAVAHQVADRFDNGAHLARLAAVDHGSDVALSVADALGVPLDGGDPEARVRSRLLGYLANRRLLLVLDNCEHVVDAVARLVDDVLATAAHVTVLTTSREALAIRGEVQVQVAPLEVPPAGTPPERVLDYSAPRLFLQRARGVRPLLELRDADMQALAEVCTRLDGMPLALELAAARVSSLSLVDLAARLHDRFRLLTTGPRTAEGRQRTLRATVEWSHALLGEPEKRVFRRLAVFHGGWTLEAAEAVAAGADVAPGEVLDVLDRLVNRSMVVCEAVHPTRYRMLETLRQYAAEQLEQSGEQGAIADRHALFFRQFADEAELGLRGRGQRQSLQRLRDEQPNLRAALAWLSADPGRIEDALHLAGALGLFWHLGRHVEGREVLRRLLAVPGGSARARARALQAVSLVERPAACLVHPSPRCAETAAESLELFVADGDAHRAALSRVLLAVELLDGSDAARFESLLAAADEQFAVESDDWGHAVIAFVRLQDFLRRGQEGRARTVGRAAISAFRGLDDAWGLSAVLYHLGWGLKEFGRYAEAVPVLEQAVEVSLAAGLYNTGQWALGELGVCLLHLGDSDAATACFDRARAASQEVGDAAGEVLASLGDATRARIDGNAAAARPLYELAVEGLRRLRTPLWGGQALAGLAWCDWKDGLLDDAHEKYERVRQAGDRGGQPALSATGLEGLARVAASRGGRGGRALTAEYLALARAVRRAAARPAPPHEQAELTGLDPVPGPVPPPTQPRSGPEREQAGERDPEASAATAR